MQSESRDIIIRPRIESGIQSPVGIQSDEAAARYRRPAVRRQRGEETAQEDLSIRLYRNCIKPNCSGWD
jgi:hypothetical protein